ncbi:hypothetical protein V5O48_014793 [Marasmius crinis-equi]|uniref:Uncharacterized protein n=1 Tax=Marasmius crinis-equi TaxID=585013 RepID=A0ABR3EWB0_9AGAR
MPSSDFTIFTAIEKKRHLCGHDRVLLPGNCRDPNVDSDAFIPPIHIATCMNHPSDHHLLLGVLRHVFGGRQTRSGNFFSPFVVDTTVEFDSLLRSAAERHEDALDSPLSTPPTSRAASPAPTSRTTTPETTQLEELLEDHTQSLVDGGVEETEEDPDAAHGRCTQGQRRRRRQKRKLDELQEVPPALSREEVEQRAKAKKCKLDEALAESKARSHRNRAKKRKGRLAALLLCPDEATLKSIARAHGKRHYPHSEKAETKVAAEKLRKGAASTGYIGNPKAELPDCREYSLEELVGENGLGMKLVKAKHTTQYVPCPKTGRIHAVIDPGPRNNPTWESDCTEGAKYLKTI